MPLSLKSIIQQAVLAASTSTMLVGCGQNSGTRHTIVVASSFPDGGQLGHPPTFEECRQICSAIEGLPRIGGCNLLGPSDDGGVVVECIDPPPSGGGGLTTGRRPAGLSRAVAQGPEFGRYLAASAHLEAASVVAFKRLGRELQAHGAPAALVTRALQSAREEVRHARTVGRLARRVGGRVPRVRVDAASARGLEGLALENATEGCVRETYGAALAAYQATHAADHALREAMATIAVDEAGHAQLAWEVAAWADTKLDRPARRRIDDARNQAIDALGSEPLGSAGLRSLAGLPGAADALAMRETLCKALWSRA